MRLRWLACAASFLGVLGCGGSPSSTNLYGGKQCTAGTTVACVGADDCAGHAFCGPGDGQQGACVCDGMGTGGITASGGGGGFPGAGGIIASGGAGGFPLGGTSGFTATGGFSFTGGFGGDLGTGGAVQVPDCPSGHYSGSYAGTFGGLLGMQQVSGNIEFTVDPSGSVTGTYTGTSPNNGAKADLVGTVDCATHELTMNVENGTYVLLGTVKFSGTMPGTYSPETHTWSGTWSLTDSSSQSGKGTWTAQ